MRCALFVHWEFELSKLEEMQQMGPVYLIGLNRDPPQLTFQAQPSPPQKNRPRRSSGRTGLLRLEASSDEPSAKDPSQPRRLVDSRATLCYSVQEY